MSYSQVKYHATHDFEPKPHSYTPNLSSKPKLPSSSMMAPSNPLSKLWSKLTSSNHLASLSANINLGFQTCLVQCM